MLIYVGIYMFYVKGTQKLELNLFFYQAFLFDIFAVNMGIVCKV
jgi:hypothetical protein